MRRLISLLRPRASDASPSDEAWQHLAEAGELERHFNQLQATYRALASTWLSATFAGIGFTIVNAKSIQSIGIDWLLMAAAISLAGAIGIGLIWNLDLLVYHRLLEVIFHTAREIERNHPSLPPFRIHMMEVTKSGGVLGHVVWFYIVGVDLLLLVGAIALSLELSQHRLPWLIAIAVGILLVIIVAGLMQWLTSHYRQQIRDFFRIEGGNPSITMQQWSPQTGTWRNPPESLSP